MQTANDLASAARSPSPARFGRRSHSRSHSGAERTPFEEPPRRALSAVDDASEGEDERAHANGQAAQETTPLLHRRDYVASPAAQRDDPLDATNGHAHDHGNSHGHGHSHSGSMNMHAVLLHVLGDALGNVGVIASGLVIWLTEWKFKYYFDPFISLVITVIIFSSALPLGEFIVLDYLYLILIIASSSSLHLLYPASGCPIDNLPGGGPRRDPGGPWCALRARAAHLATFRVKGRGLSTCHRVSQARLYGCRGPNS